MKEKLLSLFLIFFSFGTVSAQDFYGYVKKADSLSSPIFQAKVEITEGDKPFNTLKTYFDGSFKFTPAKSQTYQIKISFNGYVDTTYSFKTDKKGNLSAQNVTVKLKKDGMRLIGIVRSRDENFPINEATVVLKNVMTRKEDRATTGIDGAYNFKLDYETNYRMTLDKRSAGIFNKYEDTTFYISTVGFNIPLDYKLDIYLETIENGTTTVREGYDPTKQPENKNLKPVLGITNKPDSSIAPAKNAAIKEDKQPFKEQDQKLKGAQDSILKLKQELEKTQKQLEEVRKKNEVKAKKGGVAAGNGSSEKGKKNQNRDIEVEVIPDTPIKKTANKEGEKEKSPDELEATRLKALENRKTKESFPDTGNKKNTDTVKVKRTEGTYLIPTERTLKDSAQATQNKPPSDSNAVAKVEVKDTVTYLSEKFGKSDSIVTSQKKAIEQKVEKPYQPKSQEELVAAAEAFEKQKKIAQDSIARRKEIEKQLKRENLKKEEKK